MRTEGIPLKIMRKTLEGGGGNQEAGCRKQNAGSFAEFL